jgi:hypothetical protein
MTPVSRKRFTLLLALLALAMLACGLGDILTTPPPPAQSGPTAVPTCKPAANAQQVADILYAAQVAEHKQPGISITLLYSNSIQWIEFVKPDRFRWRTEAGGTWEEVRSIGGTVYVSSNAQPSWTVAPLLDPAIAAIMQGFINEPVQQSETEIRNQLALGGVTSVSFSGWFMSQVPDFFGSCLYALRVMSGGSPVYTQKTWIGLADGLRYKFEAMDGTGNVTETRLWDYDVKIEAP